jgi:hypothetical protein
MNRIWKFPLDVSDSISIEMPVGATILSVQMQNGQLCAWALVDESAPHETRRFRMYGTGHPVNMDDIRNFVCTFLIHNERLVFHLFEAK